jgi:hypothetical protein
MPGGDDMTNDELGVLDSDAAHIMTYQNSGQSHFGSGCDGVGVSRFNAQPPQTNIAHLPPMLR